MNRGSPRSVTSLAVETSVGSAVSCVSAGSQGPSSRRRRPPTVANSASGLDSERPVSHFKKELWVMELAGELRANAGGSRGRKRMFFFDPRALFPPIHGVVSLVRIMSVSESFVRFSVCGLSDDMFMKLLHK